MQINNKFLDDLARVATGAAGVIADAGQRLQQQLRENAPFGAGASGGVSAEEIEAVRIMALKAREAQAHLEARVAELEAAVARLSGARGGESASRGKTARQSAGSGKKSASGRKSAAGGKKRDRS
jgi:BMFP domain-containing protein YqiC